MTVEQAPNTGLPIAHEATEAEPEAIAMRSIAEELLQNFGGVKTPRRFSLGPIGSFEISPTQDYFNPQDKRFRLTPAERRMQRLIAQTVLLPSGYDQPVKLVSFGEGLPQESRILLRSWPIQHDRGYLLFNKDGSIDLWKRPQDYFGMALVPGDEDHFAREATQVDLRDFYPYLQALQTHFNSSRA